MKGSKFNGGILGYIGINILHFLMVTLTLGVAYPWALVMKERWIAKHTIIDGQQIIFDGSGLELIGSWIKWMFLTVITLGIYLFWVEIKIIGWKTKHTHIIKGENYARD